MLQYLDHFSQVLDHLVLLFGQGQILSWCLWFSKLPVIVSYCMKHHGEVTPAHEQKVILTLQFPLAIGQSFRMSQQVLHGILEPKTGLFSQLFIHWQAFLAAYIKMAKQTSNFLAGPQEGIG